MIWSYTRVTCEPDAFHPYLELWETGILPVLDEVGIVIYGVWLPEGKDHAVAWLRADDNAEDRARKIAALREHAGWRALAARKSQLEGPGTVRLLIEATFSPAGRWIAARAGSGALASEPQLFATVHQRRGHAGVLTPIDAPLGAWFPDDSPETLLVLADGTALDLASVQRAELWRPAPFSPMGRYLPAAVSGPA
jgi:hypothetical protein